MADMDICQSSSSKANDIDKSCGDTESIINEAILMAPSAIADTKRKHYHGKHHFTNGQMANMGNDSSGKQNSVVLHGPRSWKNSRRSRNGYGRGLPKKGGAGGKGVWGRPGLEDLLVEDNVIDAGDPNYDPTSENDDTLILKPIEPKHNLKSLTEDEFKQLVTPHLLEYYETGDTEEAVRCLEDSLRQITLQQRHLLVRFAIELAMDHKSSHRELTSVLLAELVIGHVLLSTDLETAFKGLLEALNDLVLDLPDAAVVLGNFLARAVADECIAPKWINVELKEVKGTVNVKGRVGRSNSASEHKMDIDEPMAAAPAATEPKQFAYQALNRAHTLLSLDHGLVRLHGVWGVGGALRPVQFLRRQMSLLLREFLSSGDINEAARCLKSLEVPHFHHELVYEAVVMALEANRASVEEQMAQLLWALHGQGLISPEQTERGFLRVFADLRDISMDVPLAYILLDRFVEKCQGKGEALLTERVVVQLPSRGRKRFVSEGDHHVLGRANHVLRGFHQML